MYGCTRSQNSHVNLGNCYFTVMQLSFYCNANPESGSVSSLFTLIRIWILLFIKMIRICAHGLLILHGSILSLHASIVSVLGPPWLHAEPQKAPEFWIQYGFLSDSSFSLIAEPDPDTAIPKVSGSVYAIPIKSRLCHSFLLLEHHLLYVHFS